MTATFADLWADRLRFPARLGLFVRSFRSLLVVLSVEWLEFLVGGGPPGRTSRHGRRGMGTWRNLRFALRTLRKAPGFTVTSVLLVAVGVGAVTTIFTLVDHVLLRPLPYPQADRLVSLDRGAFQGPLFRALSELHTVEEWGASSTDEVNLVGEGDPLRLEQARVSRDLFDLFGARALRGRLFSAEDFGTADNVVLDPGAWQRIWGADPSVVGRTIELDGEPVTVIGIMDPAFIPPERVVERSVDVWRPLDWTAEELTRHDYQVLQIAGRRTAGSDLTAVQKEVDRLMVRMADVHRNYRNRDGGPREVPVLDLTQMTVRDVRGGLGLLMGAVSLLLLVACANVANLFLARGLGRTREMAVRRATGAGTAALVGQLLVESLLVGVGGGALGVCVAWGGIRAFLLLNPTALPRQGGVTIDGAVVLFAVGVSALTALVFGLLPALRSVRVELADELRGAGRGATSGRGVLRFRNGLVIAEMALSLVLVAGAGLLLRSFLAVRSQDPGFAVNDVWVVPLTLPEPDSPEQYRAAMDDVLRSALATPGVRSAAYGIGAPMQYTGGRTCCWRTTPGVVGREEDEALTAYVHPVSTGYFETLSIEIVAGRAWNGAEAVAEPSPAVVNETFARELAGTASAAVGMAFDLRGSKSVVVGVADDTRHYGLDQDISNAVYVPMERLPFVQARSTLVVRAEPRADGSMPRALREAVWRAAPGLPVPLVQPMSEAVQVSMAGRRFDSVIFGTFATFALLLAAGGLYGTLLYVAGQREREVGIRLALGASRAAIEAGVVRSGFALGAVGAVIGLLLAWGSDRLLESRIWGIERGDPWTLGGAAALLLATAVVASWLPARRAGRVDPRETLQAE